MKELNFHSSSFMIGLTVGLIVTALLFIFISNEASEERLFKPDFVCVAHLDNNISMPCLYYQKVYRLIGGKNLSLPHDTLLRGIVEDA